MFRAILRVRAPANLCGVKFYSSPSNFEYLLVSKTGAKQNVGLIQVNRPKVLNALSAGVYAELDAAWKQFDADPSVGATVVTGNEKAFAAGADIKAMFSMDYAKWVLDRSFDLNRPRKPAVAAVNGYAFGGGLELAMLCDVIYAGEKARLALPEIKLGIFPGGGGTQRLIRSVGKSKAMELILTGDQISAQDAERMGLVSKVFPSDKVVEEAVKLAEKISSNSHLINIMAKECVDKSYELTLSEGLHFEKRMFHATFATKDQKEGMKAFVEKRAPVFTNE